MKTTYRRPRRLIRKPGGCFFCKQKTTPAFKDIDKISHYLSERGKIVNRRESGICQKHQKQLATAIKRARYLALLPFVVRPS